MILNKKNIIQTHDRYIEIVNFSKIVFNSMFHKRTVLICLVSIKIIDKNSEFLYSKFEHL